MEVLEGQNILVTISGKKNRVRVYYLSWLKSKILRTDGLVEVNFLPYYVKWKKKTSEFRILIISALYSLVRSIIAKNYSFGSYLGFIIDF